MPVFAGDRHGPSQHYLRFFWKALPAAVRAPPPDLLTWHEPHALPVCCALAGVAAACWGANVSAAPNIATAAANVEIAIAAGLKILETCVCAIGHTLCCAVTRSHWHSANRGSSLHRGLLKDVEVNQSVAHSSPMSALGQKRTFAVQQRMSALHPIATAKALFPQYGHVRFTPESGHVRCKLAMSALGQKQTWCGYYSITSSAMEIIPGGNSMPSSRAV